MRRTILVIAAVVLSLGFLATPATALEMPDWWRPVYPGNVDMRTWKAPDARPKVVPRKAAYGCTVTFNRLSVREMGVSGISRFAARFELRGFYDEGRFFVPTHQSTQWFHSKTFPDDAKSYGMYFYLHPGHITMIPTNGATYNLWVRIHGQRSGMVDVRKHINLGPVSCTMANANLRDGGGGAAGGVPFS